MRRIASANSGAAPDGGGLVKTHLDHRIAMSFAVAGQATKGGLAIDDMSPVATSFPGFVGMMQGLGAEISEDRQAAA